ncbi:MmcQ/YjbR family DNA-binding protein [Luteococcus sp. OSA5]|uniref:MmcQ/YjbR family DNA-binding protein n=1 Tax=Luteococcus sp. OSA5 TaxID=3401630 RepID=UPI003B4326FD
MHGKQLQEHAAARAEELPGSELTHPFGDDWDVYKVCGKIFMLFSEVDQQPVVILKSAPSDAKALVEGVADITPGYHMNKKHWITLHGGGTLDGQLVDDLVTESYLLVLEKLPRRVRPVDPATFGR